jgi:hypothetical protein
VVSLLVDFAVVFISLLTAIYLFNKHRKGIRLTNWEKTAIIVGLITDIAILASLVISNLPLISVLETVPLVVKLLIFAVTLIIAGVLANILRSRNFNLEPKFKHLKIYFSNSGDTPNMDGQPNRPYYIVNNIAHQAYYVPDFITRYVKKCQIAWSSYPDKEALHSYFETQNIDYKNQRDASDEELGLWILPNRKLVLEEAKIESEMLKKLKVLKAQAKFKNYQIIFLFPKYCWFLRFRSVEGRAWPPNRRILANYLTNEAYAVPNENMDLYRNGIITLDNLTPRLREDIPSWCKRKRKLEYKFRNFIIEELLEEEDKA